MKPSVAIWMGSDSDMHIMIFAMKFLESVGVLCVMEVVSAHRDPWKMIEYAKCASENGLKVIIAAAGGAAHLPGMVASMTSLPVIGVPISSTLQGIDSILSILQMPSGVPVATMALNGATNAAIFAAKILALSDPELNARLEFRLRNSPKLDKS